MAAGNHAHTASINLPENTSTAHQTRKREYLPRAKTHTRSGASEFFTDDSFQVVGNRGEAHLQGALANPFILFATFILRDVTVSKEHGEQAMKWIIVGAAFATLSSSSAWAQGYRGGFDPAEEAARYGHDEYFRGAVPQGRPDYGYRSQRGYQHRPGYSDRGRYSQRYGYSEQYVRPNRRSYYYGD